MTTKVWSITQQIYVYRIEIVTPVTPFQNSFWPKNPAPDLWTPLACMVDRNTGLATTFVVTSTMLRPAFVSFLSATVALKSCVFNGLLGAYNPGVTSVDYMLLADRFPPEAGWSIFTGSST